MRVAITGASGLVGRAVCDSLETAGHTVHRLVRTEPAEGEIRWSVVDGRIDAAALEGVGAVVHLAGESISQRWTDRAKHRIRASRKEGTRLISETLAGLETKPEVLVSASAVGFFGNSGEAIRTEDDPPGTGFLAEVAQAWEAATEPAAAAGIRVVNLRVGIVMSPDGGALKELLRVGRMGLGGPLGSGRQWVSWVSLPDLVRAIRWCIDEPTLSGPVHGVAPNPVRQRDLARAIGRAVRRPAVLPAPAFGVRMLMGEMGQQVLLEGQRCDSGRLRDAGFEWLHPDLDQALAAVIR